MEEFPPLQRGVLAGAERAGARLVVLDNLYAYGPPDGRRLDEAIAANPTSAKAATRAAMTAELLAGPPRGSRRGDHRPRVRLLRTGHHPFRSRGVGVRPGSARRPGAGDGRPRHLAQLLLHPRRRGRVDHPRQRTRGRRSGLAPSRGRTVDHPSLVEQVYALSGHRPRTAGAPAAPPCDCSGWSCRSCASTATPSTSSANPGWSTTAPSARRSGGRRRRCPRHSPAPWTGTADALP